jgi:hypothetical protein
MLGCGQQPPRSQDMNQGDYLWVTLQYSSCSVGTKKQNLEKKVRYFKKEAPSRVENYFPKA